MREFFCALMALVRAHTDLAFARTLDLQSQAAERERQRLQREALEAADVALKQAQAEAIAKVAAEPDLPDLLRQVVDKYGEGNASVRGRLARTARDYLAKGAHPNDVAVLIARGDRTW